MNIVVEALQTYGEELKREVAYAVESAKEGKWGQVGLYLPCYIALIIYLIFNLSLDIVRDTSTSSFLPSHTHPFTRHLTTLSYQYIISHPLLSYPSFTGVECSQGQPRLCPRRGGAGAIDTTIPSSHPMGPAIDLRGESGAAVAADSHQQCRFRYDDAVAFASMLCAFLVPRGA